MNPLRLAVVGAGYIGRAHIDAIAAEPRCVLAAVVDPSPAALGIAAAAGVARHPSIAALLAADRPDAVVLATPNHLHVEQTLQCTAAGLPVLLEKPVATTVVEAERLLAAVERDRSRVLVGHHRAHSPIMATAREIIAGGRLGRLVAVMGSAAFYKPAEYFRDGPWRREPGGGPILLNMIHEVHNLRMLCGEIVAVQAFASDAIRGFPVEDTVAINLRFASGALGSFLLSDTAACARSWEQTSAENPAYPSHDDEDCYVVTGTLGSLSIPTMRLKTYPDETRASWWKPFETGRADLAREDPLRRQIAHFVDVARGDAEPLVAVRDGLRNLQVTEAIATAARSGRTVDLMLPPGPPAAIDPVRVR